MEIREANPLRTARVFAEAGASEFHIEVPEGFEPSAHTVTIEGLKVVGFGKVASPYRRGMALVSVRLGERPVNWNEFHPKLYVVRLTDADTGFTFPVRFGFRTYARDGRALLVNGVRSFLRGNVDNCNFSRTGSPAMEKGEWVRILRILRDEDGINAIRFHSWTPPAAAFEAADELGVYMMPEADMWVDLPMLRDLPPEAQPHHLGYRHPVDGFVRAELDAIADAYGNSPSFMTLALGNELGGSKWDEVAKWIEQKRRDDPRRLYFASTARAVTSADDIIVTHNLPGVGMVRERFLPRTDWDYEDVYSKACLPTIAHEIGQWPVYPMWDFLGKFTGVLRPWNISRHLRTAERQNTFRFNALYHGASAKTSRLIYKDEVESFLRTPSCSGVELLNVQDFTGQGEALVGWRDPFYDLKPGFEGLDAFGRIWGVTNYLARFPKYVWTSGETFVAELEVRNLGETAIAAGTPLECVLAGRRIPVHVRKTVEPGALGRVQEVALPLGEDVAFGRHELRFGGNRWSFWKFPDEKPASPPPGVTVTDRLSVAADRLKRGETVVYVGAGSRESRDTFKSVYWSGSKTWSWVPPLSCTLGTCVFASHPALRGFPTEDWADWQWYDLVQGANLHELRGLPEDFRPITLSVNDFHFSRFVSALFEVRVGPGRLLVCGYPIDADTAASRRLRASLFSYLAQSDPVGAPVMDETWFRDMFAPRGPERLLKVRSAVGAQENK